MDKNRSETEDKGGTTARGGEGACSRPPTYEEVLSHSPPQIDSAEDASKSDADLLIEELERGEAKTPDYEEL